MLAPALTILLSSFLLFLVQPILAKEILPWFGGSASVWTVCLVFFQSVLVLGYAYAHWLTRRRSGARQLMVHLCLLLASCLMLPVIPAAFWRQAHESAPAARILGLLATTVGLPYFLLASTAPLLQKWLSSAREDAAGGFSVYRLFALSNFGSLAGLLCYPFVVEPFVPLRAQAWLWSAAYALFVISSIGYAWSRRRLPDRGDGREQTPAPGSAPKMRRYAYWVGCSALGSILLLSATNQITQNVAAMPLLWIVPLTLYLLSFTLVFEGRSGRGWYERRFWVTPAMLAVGAMAWAVATLNLSVYVAVPLYAAGVFLGCLLCHGELALTKPATQHLTHFYLSLAAGGALGGMLVGLAAPLVFKDYWEMPLAVAALALLGLHCVAQETRQRRPVSWAANAAVAVLVTLLILLMVGRLPHALDRYTAELAKIVEGDARWGCVALLLLGAWLLQRYRLWRAVALSAVLCAATFGWSAYHERSAGARFATRNFYGALSVLDAAYGSGELRRLIHGTIVHGSQILQRQQARVPTTYYGPSSGIGRVLSSAGAADGPPLRIGSVGLGAGTLAAYGRAGDLLRIYEINPADVGIARTWFTYLSDSKARIEIVLGDGRLSLENELARGVFDAPEQRYDVLSLDAFSGDAIPLHLLTREAFATYARVTKPGGVIAFHVSNRYLNLAPVVARVARAAGYQAVLIADRPLRGAFFPSDWVVVTRNAATLRQPEIATHSSAIAAAPGAPLWTDEFTSLLQALR